VNRFCEAISKIQNDTVLNKLGVKQTRLRKDRQNLIVLTAFLFAGDLVFSLAARVSHKRSGENHFKIGR